MMAMKHSTRPTDIAICKVTHVGFDINELSIRYWGAASKNLLNAALKPEFFDP